MPAGDSVRLRGPDDIAAQLGDIVAHFGETHSGLVLCAHSHVPRWVKGLGRIWILNPGSVDLPAYSLAEPAPHKMQVGSPDARYAVVEKTGAGWRASHIAVPYDYEKAAAAAQAAGFRDWALALRTGYAA